MNMLLNNHTWDERDQEPQIRLRTHKKLIEVVVVMFISQLQIEPTQQQISNLEIQDGV